MTVTPDLFKLLHPESLVTPEQLAEAAALRDLGLPYRALAVVMGRYHGAWYAPATWRMYLREIGQPVSRPNNFVRAGVSTGRTS